MLRLICALAMVSMVSGAVRAESEEMERLAMRISEEIRSNLLAVETKVAYVGMEGSRAYLVGDLATVRPGQPVVFYRDGAAILSSDNPPQILGRESLEVGRGKIAALHDRTAWVQIDTGALPRSSVSQGDWAVVQLDIPTLHVIPFFLDDGRGTPVEDGRGRILRSLILYHLKRRGLLKVLDAPMHPTEVDASGLPLPSSLSQFDTSGVLLIGRILPNTAFGDELIVGAALFDLSLRDMRFARSYQVKTLAAFSPIVPPTRKTAERSEPALSAPPQAQTAGAAVEVREAADPLKGIARIHVSSSLRMEWPPKTPSDEMILDLVAAPLPELAVEWAEDTPGQVRIVLPVATSVPFGAPLTAQRCVEHLSERSLRPSAKSLIGNGRWTVLSDREILLAVDTPLTDLRDRLNDPEFRLVNDLYEPIAYGVGPYRVVSKGVRTTVLEKLPSARGSGIWSKAPDTLILTLERDPKKRSAGFQEGKVDLHEILDDEYLKYGPASKFRTIQSSPEELVALAFNLRRAPGSEVHFRRMIAMVLDRRTVLELSLNQRGVPAEGILPAGFKEVAPVLVKLPEKSDQSILAAQVLAKQQKELLSDSGLTLIFPVEEPHYGLIAESIRSDLQVLNLAVEPRGLSWRAYADRISTGEYDLAVVALTPYPPFRLWIQRQFSSTGKDNPWGYRNTIVDALVSESGDLGAAQDLIQRDLPVVPLFWLSRRIALGPRIAEGWPSGFPAKFFSSLQLK